MGVPLKKNTASQIRYIMLFDGSDTKTTPTISAGDFKVSIDGGAEANLGTLPSESPAASGWVKITFSQAETNGDTIAVRWSDPGATWDDGGMTWDTETQQIGELSTQTSITNLNDPTAVAIRTEMDSNSTQLSAIVSDTNELQTDWVDGGRLDLLIDAIKTVTDSLTDLNTVIDGVIDEVLIGATHNVTNSLGRRIRELDEQIGYEGGAIWIDTVNGVAGTTVGENGTVNNPVDSITDALALAVAIGITRLRVASGSSITLVAALEGYEIYNFNWTLALGGQSVSGSCIGGAAVSGICTGVIAPDFIDCQFGNATLPPSHLVRCSFSGTITAGSAGSFFLENCYSAVAGTSAPTFDFGSGLNASNVNFRHYSGGVEIQNMGAGSGSYNMSLEGFGQLIINANCSATSTVAIRGNFTVTDNAGGAITLSDDARIDVDQVAGAALDGVLADHDTEDTIGNVLNDLTEESGGLYRYTSAALAEAPTGGAGSGAITFTYTLTNSVGGAPISDASVWATNDLAGNNVIASGTTNTSGQVVFLLDAGIVYIWRQKAGFNFTNPDAETVA